MQRFRKLLIVVCNGIAMVLTSCVTSKTADVRAREAFMAGQKRGLSMQTDTNTVWLVGNVKTPLLHWTDDLTLAKAIVDAGYQGANDPRQIVVFRSGQPPIRIDPQQILKGFDLPLQAGDRVELRP